MLVNSQMVFQAPESYLLYLFQSFSLSDMHVNHLGVAKQIDRLNNNILNDLMNK